METAPGLATGGRLVVGRPRNGPPGEPAAQGPWVAITLS